MDKQILYRAVPVEEWKKSNPLPGFYGIRMAGGGLRKSYFFQGDFDLDNITHVLEPITLPTEEEIEKAEDLCFHENLPPDFGVNPYFSIGFQKDVEWFKNKITGKL